MSNSQGKEGFSWCGRTQVKFNWKTGRFERGYYCYETNCCGDTLRTKWFLTKVMEWGEVMFIDYMNLIGEGVAIVLFASLMAVAVAAVFWVVKVSIWG